MAPAGPAPMMATRLLAAMVLQMEAIPTATDDMQQHPCSGFNIKIILAAPEHWRGTDYIKRDIGISDNSWLVFAAVYTNQVIFSGA
jgi:hypothetical protein